MKRAMLYGPGELVLETCAEPAPGPGEVVVEVAACGICGSDLHSFHGEHPLVIYPVTPGHEFSGTVVSLGEGVDEGWLNTDVCVEPSLFCGKCHQCISGRYNICENLKVMGFQAPGAMCELVAVGQGRLHPLGEGVDLTSGAIAEPAAVGVHAFARSGVESGGPVLVVGAGVIGLMVLKAALAEGCEVFVIEGSPERAARSVEMGARGAFVFGELEPREVPGACGGARFAAVFECVGKEETIDFALRAAPRGGTVVAVGVPPGPVPVAMPLVQDGELDVRGTLMYTGGDFKRALDLIRTGSVSAREIVTHALPLEDIESAYRIASEAEPSTLKVLLEIGGGG